MASVMATRFPATRSTHLRRGIQKSGQLKPRAARVASKEVRPLSESGRLAYGFPLFFLISLFTIIGFAGVDTYLNIKYPVTADVEENPIARWLLLASHNNLGLLMAVKMMGTSLASCVLVAIYQRRKDLAVAIAGSVALCVSIMLGYMIS